MNDILVSSPCLDASSLRERVTVCSGITVPDPSPLDGGDCYIEGALIAANPWQPVDDNVWNTLYASSPQSIGNSVFLDRPAGRLIDMLHDFDSGGKKHATTSMRAPMAVRREVERTLDATGSVRRLGPVLGIGPTPHNRGGLETLTRTYPEVLRTGLHIDNWDHMPLERCDEAANRLSVNLGEDARFLLFAAVSVVAMVERIRRDDPDIGTISRTDLVPTFLSLEPSTPIFRIEIRPGEAYYAPTENLLHDASNQGASSVDRTVQIRGFLMPAGSTTMESKGRAARKQARRIPIQTIASSAPSIGIQS